MIFLSKDWETGQLGFWNIKKLSYEFWIKTLRNRKLNTEEAILWFLDQNIERQET